MAVVVVVVVVEVVVVVVVIVAVVVVYSYTCCNICFHEIKSVSFKFFTQIALLMDMI